MPRKNLIERAEYDREYHARPEIRERDNEGARRRYENGGKDVKKAYDAERRRRPDIAAKRTAYMKERRRRDWAKTKIAELRCRARKMGMPFDLAPEDLLLPEVCPVFGTKLVIGDRTQSSDSPSVDRIDNDKGYVKGNVVVVSHRANSLKRDASLAEMKRLVEFYESFQPKE